MAGEDDYLKLTAHDLKRVYASPALDAYAWCKTNRIHHGFMDGVVLVVNPITTVAFPDRGSPTGLRLFGFYAAYDGRLPAGAVELRKGGKTMRQFVAVRSLDAT
jgi:hypothetical protein